MTENITQRQSILVVLSILREKLQGQAVGLSLTFEYRALLDAIADFELLLTNVNDGDLDEH